MLDSALSKLNKLIKDYAPMSSLLFLLILVFGFISVNLYLLSFGFYDFSFFQIRYVLGGILCTLIFLLLASPFLKLIAEARRKPWALSMICGLLLATFLASLIIFSLIYPKIPYAWGGGKAINVAILFDKDHQGAIPYLQSNINGEQYLLAKLIFQTPDYLLVETNRGSFLVFTSEIQSIFYPNDSLVENGMNLGKPLIFAP